MRIAIIPARGGSKRIARKNVMDFCGQPLLSYPLAAARASGLFDMIHVSTEDSAIADAAAKLGFAPEFLRDPALADDQTPLIPVAKWVLAQFALCGKHFDTVAILLATAPLVDAEDLQAACALFDRGARRVAVLAVTPFPVPIEWAMRLEKDGSMSAVQPEKLNLRSQDIETRYYDSGTFVFYPPERVMAYPRVNTDFLAYRLPRDKAVDIDTPEDLTLAEALFRGRAKRQR